MLPKINAFLQHFRCVWVATPNLPGKWLTLALPILAKGDALMNCEDCGAKPPAGPIVKFDVIP